MSAAQLDFSLPSVALPSISPPLRAMTILPLPAAVPLSIGQLAERELQKSPYYFLKGLSCDFRDGVLTLRGSVPFAQLRACAERIVSRVDGVETVVNRVEVTDPSTMAAGGRGVRTAG